MKNFLTPLLVSVLLASACTSNKSSDLKTKETLVNQLKAGADVDANGCKGSAGYQFSIVKNRCIRVWEEGIRFEEINPTKTGNQPKVAFVIFSDDKKKAEVQFGGTDKPVILEKQKVVEGETQPVYFENKMEMITIDFAKHIYWINYNGKRVYSIAVNDMEKFENLLFY